MPVEYLINMSEIEKHKNIMWFNLMKYKFCRNLSSKYGSFTEAQNVFDYFLTIDFETAKNIKLYYRKIDWSVFALKINKLNKYIINFNIKEKKLKFIIELFTKKLENGYDLYERIFRFFKILSSCMTKEDLINLYSEIIKYLF